MEQSTRFTACEGGARLAACAAAGNTLATEYCTFISTRLLHEEGYSIRGPISEGYQRSVYVTRPTRVPVVAHELSLLTDLTVTQAVKWEDVDDWTAELDIKQVVVCTSSVLQRLLEDQTLNVSSINVLVLDSCHLISKDHSLKYIMQHYKQCEEDKRPRILALTYPLFQSIKKADNTNTDSCKIDNIDGNTPTSEENTNSVDESTDTSEENQSTAINTENTYKNDILKQEKQIVENIESTNTSSIEEKLTSDKKDGNKLTLEENKSKLVGEESFSESADQNVVEKSIQDKIDSNQEVIIAKNMDIGEKSVNEKSSVENHNLSVIPKNLHTEDSDKLKTENKDKVINQNYTHDPNSIENLVIEDKQSKSDGKMGVYENYDDFNMYEKLEWKIEELERELCCKMDLAEDIDGGKRISATITKPKELIVEYSTPPKLEQMPELYVQLDEYMRRTVHHALHFVTDHRYDPTEIYGEEMYEEFKDIPDPTTDPKLVFQQFIYILDELGPYAADKAAFSLLTKLEKLKVKVPYERHFLLLCLCTSVFVKIRCYADYIFSTIENDWDKIKLFSTPKVLRFAEILEKFQPPESASIKNFSSDKNEMLKTIDSCDFMSLSNKIEDRINICEGGLKELSIENFEINDAFESQSKEHTLKVQETITEDKNAQKNTKDTQEEIVSPNLESKIVEVENVQSTIAARLIDQRNALGFHRQTRIRGRGRSQRHNASRAQQSLLNPDALCGIVFMKDPLVAKIMFMIVVDMSRSNPKLNYLCAQYCAETVTTEPKECIKQGNKQEEVLKKFRMHECNLLLATPALEEGIDLPRCNLVLRWDVPASYRSYGLCRSRARAPRASCALLCQGEPECTEQLVRHMAVYRELDQMISRKCGCGIQDEPPPHEEDHADRFTQIVKPYTHFDSSSCQNATVKLSDAKLTNDRNNDDLCSETFDKNDSFTCQNTTVKCFDTTLIDDGIVILDNTVDEEKLDKNDKISSQNDSFTCQTGTVKDDTKSSNCDNKTLYSHVFDNVKIKEDNCATFDSNVEIKVSDPITLDTQNDDTKHKNCDEINSRNCDKDVKKCDTTSRYQTDIRNTKEDTTKSVMSLNIPQDRRDKKSDELASVDLSTAIALVNRYCAKLPSDTFTRLAPQWWMEQVRFPTGTAYVCTLRLPLNCPVKYNIVGHPMPTRVLARRMVALQACRILHKSGELDNQLMPIGKENFKAVDMDTNTSPVQNVGCGDSDPNDPARPGTTKRRQYYYKRTAWAFTDCQPVIDTSDTEIDPQNSTTTNQESNISADESHMKLGAAENIKSAKQKQLDPAEIPKEHETPNKNTENTFIENNFPKKEKPKENIDIKEQKENIDIEEQKVNIDIEDQRENIDIEEQKNNIDIEEQKENIDIEEQNANVHSDSEQDESSDSECNLVYEEGEICKSNKGKRNTGKRNMLYAIVSSLWCSLPERYNTRGRRLHSPQHADQAIGVLMARHEPDSLQIPSFPVYTRSGEVRVSIEHVPDADARISPRRGRLVRRFMRFVFAEVLRVRRRGMKLQADGTYRNNYYIVPTIKFTRPDGTTKIDIDWAFLEVIYQHTEEKKHSDVEKPILWHLDEEEKESEHTNKEVQPPRSKENVSNPLLKEGETFVFDPDKYTDAVVTPWYRNQDQPQFFLVAEICCNLTPDSAFPSATHTSFRHYYQSKYGVALTQPNQPLLDVDHTSARLNLLTPRYVNRKGVALPVSSERTRRAKRDRLDQKQILVPELCRVHPFAAPLWFATVALPCVLYRINALLIADEIRRSVAIDVGLGIPKIEDKSFQWPPLDFGWSLAEVLNADSEKSETKKEHGSVKFSEINVTQDKPEEQLAIDMSKEGGEPKEKTLNDILQETEATDGGFEIGTWSNDMASNVPEDMEYDEYNEPLPPNLTFCTSASGGTNWCEPIQKPKNQFNPSKHYSMADSDDSFMSSDFDTDDSDMSEGSVEDDTSGFGSSKNSCAALGVRIEYKTAHEAEAVDLERQLVNPAPQPDPADDAADRRRHEASIREGQPTIEHLQKFHASVEKHKNDIIESGCLIPKHQPIVEILPETHDKLARNYCQLDNISQKLSRLNLKTDSDTDKENFINEMFPYGKEELKFHENGQIDLESLERNKRKLLDVLKKSLTHDEIKKLNCFSMKDVNIDSPDYVNEKVVNIGFNTKEAYEKKVNTWGKETEYTPYYEDRKGHKFDFDHQPKLEGHPGPSPSVILQALTMSNANDGINLERLETIGDSFLKFAITAYLYCAHPTVHEGKLSHMRSKQVSNVNLYRLGRNKRLGARMIASKFEPHDNWLPPCHKPPPTLQAKFHNSGEPDELRSLNPDMPQDSTGCFIPYNLITQHSIPDKSIADCVEALIGAYLLECGPRGALLFMSWLGIKVLPRHEIELSPDHPYVVRQREKKQKPKKPPPKRRRKPKQPKAKPTDSDSDSTSSCDDDDDCLEDDWSWPGRPVGSLQPFEKGGKWKQPIFGELKAPPSPLLRYISDPEGELERMLSGYDALEERLQYRFKDRSLLLQAVSHASHQPNRLTDCYQRLEFLGDAILDYLITRHLYEDPRRHSPGALTDLRSALVNNTIFATLAARLGLHKFFRHMSPGLNDVLTKYVKIQEENGHSISEEHYLIQEDEMDQAEDVEVPKALGDLFESVAGAIFLDSGMSLQAVWNSYVLLMGAELEAFSAAAPKSPVRELLEAEPDTAKFGKPERLADGRRVRVCVEVFGRGTFKGIGRNYRIAKGTAARCALRHLKIHRR